MLSIIVPTLNEKKNIKILSRKLCKIHIISEIIFVDDNSIDGTYEEIKKIKNKKVRGYLRNSKNKDLSKSVLMGIKKTKNRNILVMDGDMQHDTEYIKKMWKEFHNSDYDLIVASRFYNKNYIGNLGPLRSMISRLAISTINFIFGKLTSDPLSGFFICKKKLIMNYKKYFFSKGYKILFDILYNSKKDLKIKDINIKFKKRYFEKSKFNLRIILLFFMQILFTKFVVKK